MRFNLREAEIIFWVFDLGEVKGFGRLEDKDFSAVAFQGHSVADCFDSGESRARCTEEFLSTGTISGIKIGPEVLLLFALLVLVPLIMAFLSLILNSSADRWSNITLGVVFTVLGFIDLAETAENPSAWAILIGLSEIAATVLIVWYAWKSKQKT
jgi:hypothetical protein